MTCPVCRDQRFRVVAAFNDMHYDAAGKLTMSWVGPVIVTCSACAEPRPRQAPRLVGVP